MAVKSSGPLSLQEIATEFGDTAPHSSSEFYRGGAKVPDAASNSSIPTSGAINIGGFYGAQNRVTLNITISANTSNYDLYTTASANPEYQAGITDINLTVNPGVTVSSSSTGTYALQIPNGFDSGDNVTLINQGTIVGRAGNGGNGGPYSQNNATAGGAGGNALYVNRATTITNNGTLAGAGGGGGGSGGANLKTGTWPKGGGNQYSDYGGQGGGGGAGVPAGSGGNGGAAGGAKGGNPGNPGTATTAGTGGARNQTPFAYTGAGGAGGARGAAGTAGEPWGGTVDPSTRQPSKAGGAAGKYLVGSPYVTWDVTGTRLGSAT